MNSVNLTGNITKELEVKYSTSGTAYLKFTLAVKRKGKEDKTDFVPITAFNKSAELIAQYCGRGSKLGVSGRLQIDTENENGNYKTFVSVIVDGFDFLDSKKDNAVKEKPSAYETPFDPFAGQGTQIDVNDSDLPF